MPDPTRSAAWQALQSHAEGLHGEHLRDWLDADPGRAERYVVAAAGVRLDYSRQRVNDALLARLLDLARELDVAGWRAQMFAGAHINTSEDRAVLHVALRDLDDSFGCMVDGQPVQPAVAAELARVARFSDALRSGAWTGYSGRPISDVVNLGIGGSDLGPRMVCTALAPYHDGPRVHFVSNVDGHALDEVLRGVSRESVLFVIASKTFTTQETLTNAHAARQWLLDGGAPESAIARHFVAVSTHAEAVAAFGIDPGNMFGFWEWVGGRYSLWSAIGLPIALAIGMPRFLELLRGAHAMDTHFRNAPPAANLPLLFGLLGTWNRSFLGCDSYATVPYDHRLRLLPAYLQQLDMESNGKGVTRDGDPVGWQTGPVAWGGVGSDAQHAFFQLLHQGTRVVPVDFILVDEPHHAYARNHAILHANGRAQADALARGRRVEELVDANARFRGFPGNRPSSILSVARLEPATLGALLALLEHKVFVQGVLWSINSFDQWGVELGKELAQALLARDPR